MVQLAYKKKKCLASGRGKFSMCQNSWQGKEETASVDSLASLCTKMSYFSTQSRKCMCLHAFYPHRFAVFQFQKAMGRSSLWLPSKFGLLPAAVCYLGSYSVWLGEFWGWQSCWQVFFFIEQLKHAPTGGHFYLLTWGITLDQYAQNPPRGLLSVLYYLCVSFPDG